ncbi:hypothetical protein L484_016068 [Morus notabilis]|uniref:Uncharacterized protein n=1 Tax=Morus notabilis TaxID=981085 RepID=W9RZC3_9ROSA|nr:hypothetical protein L484_016068 [Morus notabilis]
MAIGIWGLMVSLKLLNNRKKLAPWKKLENPVELNLLNPPNLNQYAGLFVLYGLTNVNHKVLD